MNFRTAPKGYVVCPYDESHAIFRERIQQHIIKCGRQYPFVQLSVCVFDASHIVKKDYLDDHLKDCPSGKTINALIVQVGPNETRKAPEPSLPANFADDDWECSSSVSVLDQVKVESEGKATLLPLIGGTKSERRAYREEQRRKTIMVQNDLADQEKKAAEPKSKNVAQEKSLTEATASKKKIKSEEFEIKKMSEEEAVEKLKRLEIQEKGRESLDIKMSGKGSTEKPKALGGTSSCGPSSASGSTFVRAKDDPWGPVTRRSLAPVLSAASLASHTEFPGLPVAAIGRGKKNPRSNLKL